MSDTKRKKILFNPGKKYAPSSGSWGGLASAYLDGKPVFTWFDVPRMLRDPQVQFGLRMLRAPFQSAKWKVKAEHPRLAKFVDDSLKKLWQQVTPMLLHHYFSWGYAAASVSFTEKNNRFVVEGCNVFQSTDIKPRVWTEGPKKGEFAAVEVSSIGEPMELVGKPHGIWFAGLQEHGKFFDRPRLAGAFEPWLESNGRNGAKASRRLWSRKCAFDSGMIRHPLGDVNIGTDESPNMVAGMDLAREILDAHESGSGMTLPNTPNQSGSGYAWEWTPPSSRGDAARVLDYPEQLDKEILRGLGIPPEVIEASEVGSGWSGRSIPMMAYLGSADEIVVSLIHAIVEFVIRPAAVINFGKRGSDFEVDAVPLAKVLMPDQVDPQGKQDQQQQPSSPFGMPQPQPGQPVQLSFVAEQTRVGTTKAVGQGDDSGRVLYGKDAKTALAADDTVPLDRAPDKDQLGAIGRAKHRLGQKREELTKRIEALPGGNAILATGRIGLKIFHAVEKPLMFAQRKSQAIAVQVAKERGFSEEQTTTLARALTVADFAGGYVTGGVALTLAGPMAAKAASFLPSASLAYVAYSAAKDPVATYNAAKKVIAETFGRSGEDLSMIDNPAFAKRLTDTIADLPSDQADWFIALFSAAIEHTEGDAEKAFKLAVAGLKKGQPVQLSSVQQPGIKPDDLSALTLALIDAAMEDDDQSLERLTDLLNDPEALAEAVSGGSANLSWVEYGQSRTGKSRWKDTATGQVRYQKSKPGSRVERKATANATLATEAIASIKSGKATTEDLAKFAENIDSLTKPQLKQLRQELGAKFAVNVTYRDSMVKQLRRYVSDPDNFREPSEEETAAADARNQGRPRRPNKPVGGKPGHLMTRAERVAAIRQAIDNGEHVPDEVLEDYPELHAGGEPTKPETKPEAKPEAIPAPKFTGIDSNGHQWENGVQVARGKEASQAPDTATGTPDMNSGRGGSAPDMAGASNKPKAKPEEITKTITDTFEDLLQSKKHSMTGMVPIYEIREEIRKKYGDNAASNKMFDELMWDLWKTKKYRFTPMSDRSRFTPEQLDNSLTSMGDYYIFMERRNAAATPPSASSQSPTNGVDNPPTVGNTTPVPQQVAGGKQEGGKMSTTTKEPAMDHESLKSFVSTEGVTKDQIASLGNKLSAMAKAQLVDLGGKLQVMGTPKSANAAAWAVAITRQLQRVADNANRDRERQREAPFTGIDPAVPQDQIRIRRQLAGDHLRRTEADIDNGYGKTGFPGFRYAKDKIAHLFATNSTYDRATHPAQLRSLQSGIDAVKSEQLPMVKDMLKRLYDTDLVTADQQAKDKYEAESKARIAAREQEYKESVARGRAQIPADHIEIEKRHVDDGSADGWGGMDYYVNGRKVSQDDLRRMGVKIHDGGITSVPHDAIERLESSRQADAQRAAGKQAAEIKKVADATEKAKTTGQAQPLESWTEEVDEDDNSLNIMTKYVRPDGTTYIQKTRTY